MSKLPTKKKSIRRQLDAGGRGLERKDSHVRLEVHQDHVEIVHTLNLEDPWLEVEFAQKYTWLELVDYIHRLELAADRIKPAPAAVPEKILNTPSGRSHA